MKNWRENEIKKDKKIITVSEFTRQDVLKKYSVDSDKVVAVYNGFQVRTAQKKESLTTTGGYILYVGTLQPRKNVITLIKSFHLVSQYMPDLKLVIVGKRGWLYDKIFTEVANFDLQDKVEFTDFIPDDELAQLFTHARLFVHPSLYEGFGLPILEAMSYGCPVLAASGSSFEEIGGSACEYFNPRDTIELKNKILRLMNDGPLRKELVEKGHEQVKKFSWDECARQTLDILRSI